MLNQQSWQRLVLGMLVAMLLLSIGSLAVLVRDAHTEYTVFRKRATDAREQVQTARKELAQREAYLTKALNDPSFLEQIVRERLNYSKPDEIIFRFEEPPSR